MLLEYAHTGMIRILFLGGAEQAGVHRRQFQIIYRAEGSLGNFIAIGRFFSEVSCTGTRQVALVCVTTKSYTRTSVQKEAINFLDENNFYYCIIVCMLYFGIFVVKGKLIVTCITREPTLHVINTLLYSKVCHIFKCQFQQKSDSHEQS